MDRTPAGRKRLLVRFPRGVAKVPHVAPTILPDWESRKSWGCAGRGTEKAMRFEHVLGEHVLSSNILLHVHAFDDFGHHLIGNVPVQSVQCLGGHVPVLGNFELSGRVTAGRGIMFVRILLLFLLFVLFVLQQDRTAGVEDLLADL